MLTVPRISLVERVAAQVLRDHEITSLPVCPIKIAEKNAIMVEGKPAGQPGCSGMLLRKGDNFGILYSTNIRNRGFQRFSIAHELGHYFLPDHPENVIQHGMHVSKAGFGSSDPYEREADFFAAALLMPRRLVGGALAALPDGLEGVLELADQCETSLTATAINYAKVTDTAVAVVLSNNGIVACCFQSDRLKRARVGWISKGEPVPLGTLTAEVVLKPAMPAEPEAADTDLQRWFGTNHSVPATEEVIRLHRTGEFLTLLSAAHLSYGDDEDEEDADEADLIESWTPRFRR